MPDGMVDTPLVAQMCVAHTWAGRPLAPQQHTHMQVRLGDDCLTFAWEAPFFNDPRPGLPPGPCPRLWEHEVVECFLAAPGGRPYLEFEFGPHGHWLALRFSGYRQLERELQLDHYECRMGSGRWSGTATTTDLGEGVLLVCGNAYLIHGQQNERQYWACRGDATSEPDFHRAELFLPLEHQQSADP